MNYIALEGMTFYAHHGYYVEERKLGNHYVIDVKIAYDMDAAADTDDLEKSLNYEDVYAICVEEMKSPRHLIEAVAKSIAIKIQARFPDSGNIAIRLEKLNPPLSGSVEKAVVHYEV